MANKKLNAIITIGGAVAGSLKSAFSDVKSNVDQVGGKIADLTRRQKTLSDTITTFARMGRDVSKFRDQYADVTRQIERATRAQQKLNDITRRQAANRAARGELMGGLFGVVGAAAATAAPIKQAMQFESQMAEVKKVVNVDGTQAEQNTYFAKLGDQVLELTRKLPMAADQVAKLVAAGGQGGIDNSELLKFTEMAGKMGVAFDISADEAGQSMAEMKSAFGIPLDKVGELADKINYLGNTTSASAKNIMEIVQRVGPLGGVAGTSSGQIAALAATLRGMGVQNEVAATGIQNFMLALTKGEAATKAQKTALKELGYGSKQVAGSMQKDAQQTMTTILKSVQRMPRARQAAILSQLFGVESIKAIAPLLDQLPQLEANFRKVADATQYGGSMQKEYDAIAATTTNKLQLMRNGFNEVAITIGSKTLPAIGQLADTTLPYLGAATDMIKAHPQLTTAIIGTAAAFTALTVAIYAGRIAGNVIMGNYLSVVGAVTKMRSAFTMATLSVRGLNLAMMANPIGLVVAAVAVGAALIIKYWDQIKSYSVGLWQGLTENLGPVKESFGQLGDALGPIGSAFKWLGGMVGDVVGWFIDLFKPVNATKKELDEAGASGKEFGKKIADGLLVVKAPIEWLISKLQWIGEKMGPIMDKANAVGDKVGGAVKSGWNSVTGWINDTVNGDGAGAPAPGSRNAGGWPTPPAMASRGNNTTVTDNSKTEVKIYQQPGENAEALAKRTAEMIRKERQTAGRSNMADGWAPL